MNMIEKILAKASGKTEVAPGEVVIANVNLMVMHDLSANFVTRVFREELGGGSILDPSPLKRLRGPCIKSGSSLRNMASSTCLTAAMAVCIT